MKAWHVQDTQGDYQQIVFAEKRSEAIQASDAISWVGYIDVRARRAPYADNLHESSKELKKQLLLNGWWFECGKCSSIVTIDDIENADQNVTENGNVFCDRHIPKL
ncbi:hypothetical protein P8825_15065 [Shouchella clausii]|uniref:hypothetical protein n=1 Tax=Shouchella clausii TaxID=79880 RepID=UPI002DBE8CC0|nr:hypothetical protein [Shouchella clausii]MEB5480884.1 hypothetical protein [Shouchella clausii]